MTEISIAWQQITFAELPELTDSQARGGLQAFTQSCEHMSAPPLIYGKTLPGSQWHQLCTIAQITTPDDAYKFFTDYFTPYRLHTNIKDTGLLTGYYIPTIRGSLKQNDVYDVALYAKPDETLRTQYDRAAIDNGALREQVPEILYLDDAVDAFFLHIQGSGMVVLPDGSRRMVRYSGKNDFPYTAIGKHFIDEGIVAKDAMSLAWLKDWLRTHPQQADAVMQRNQSYIFFTLDDTHEGNAVGAQGAELTPMHSIAVDPEFIGYGIPFFIQAPQDNLAQLVVAQDTGSAIKGHLRADLFTGYGEDGEQRAGHLKSEAFFTILLPKGIAP